MRLLYSRSQVQHGIVILILTTFARKRCAVGVPGRTQQVTAREGRGAHQVTSTLGREQPPPPSSIGGGTRWDWRQSIPTFSGAPNAERVGPTPTGLSSTLLLHGTLLLAHAMTELLVLAWSREHEGTRPVLHHHCPWRLRVFLKHSSCWLLLLPPVFSLSSLLSLLGRRVAVTLGRLLHVASVVVDLVLTLMFQSFPPLVCPSRHALSLPPGTASVHLLSKRYVVSAAVSRNAEDTRRRTRERIEKLRTRN